MSGHFIISTLRNAAQAGLHHSSHEVKYTQHYLHGLDVGELYNGHVFGHTGSRNRLLTNVVEELHISDPDSAFFLEVSPKVPTCAVLV
jgi:hypothetical protein